MSEVELEERTAPSPVEAPPAGDPVVALFEAGLTPPFIARFRCDESGGLDEQAVLSARRKWRNEKQVADRKASILRSLETQGKLTDELATQIRRADSLHRLDDLYLPHKPRQASPASEALEQGLGPLAEEILNQAPSTQDLDARSAEFINEDKKVTDAATALAGAGKVLAERFSQHAELRRRARSIVRKTGKLTSRRAEGASDKKAETYKAFLNYNERLAKAPPHRVLAINRGERAKALAVGVEVDEQAIVEVAKELLVPAEHLHADFVAGCAEQAVREHLIPALVEEARQGLLEQAEEHAMEVFARNLRNLLLGPRLPGRRVLAIDPGYQNGCNLAALDEEGGLLAVAKVSIVGEGDAIADARKQVAAMVIDHGSTLVAIGNGKACRPAEELVSSLLAEELKDQGVEYLVVSEAGANVYASSTVGREELPALDSHARSAVSIGRRVQDPLAELVKVDPSSVGVGLYQHDAKSKAMRDALEEVVSSCVAHVGVDLNTASASLLRNVPGLNALSARRVCELREQNGPFTSRKQLGEAPGVNDAAYQQAAGFVKVSGGEDPFDTLWLHPDDYDDAKRLLAAVGFEASDLVGEPPAAGFRDAIAPRDRDTLAKELGVGRRKLDRLIDALSNPGGDPRDALPPPAFRRGIVRFEDLEPGAELEGSVLNVVDFGAFVDIGLSDSGLLHISRMSTGFVSDPHALVSVGDRVRVWVDSVDKEKRRVSLSLIDPSAPKPERPQHVSRRRGGGGGGGGGDKRKREEGKTEGGSRQRSDKPRRGKPPRGKHGKRPEQPRGPRVYEARSKEPPRALTQEMEEGTEAMRTFGDLLQLYKKKKSGDDDSEPNKSDG